MDRAYPQTSAPLINPFFLSFRQLGRYGRNFALAAVATAVLLFAMSRLIATDYVEPEDDGIGPIKPVVMPEIKLIEYWDQTKVEPPQPVPTETVVERQVIDPETPTIPIDIAPPGPANEGTTITVSRDPVPVFKPAPNYPSRALRRGIEGYVVVEFTITKTGSVRDVRAVAGYDSEGSPTEIFNRSAEKAAARFKYQPQLDDGVAVERHGVRNRITYKMAD